MELKPDFKLPLTMGSTIDVARAMRELNALNDFMVASSVRTPGTALQLPKLTRQLEELARLNDLNLTDEAHRKELSAQLNAALGRCPVLHISFAAEPPVKALETILLWLRKNINPHILLTVGLQPGIAAGCVLRTPNLLFDMSLRAHLKQQEPYAIELIRGATNRVTKDTEEAAKSTLPTKEVQQV